MDTPSLSFSQEEDYGVSLESEETESYGEEELLQDPLCQHLLFAVLTIVLVGTAMFVTHLPSY